jgi:hypothetical protein
MLAFTPIPDALIALARSDSEFTPDPVLKDVCEPPAAVIVRVEAPRLELLLGIDGEYHDALLARLCTDIKCEPAAAPGAAVPVTWGALDETARAASGPLMLFKLSRSFDTDERAVWSAVSAVICDEMVDCSLCH